MTVSVETTGLSEAISKLKKQSKALRNLEPPYKRFAAEIVKKTDDGFQNSKGYDGEDWDPLSDYTIENRLGSLKAANRYTSGSEKRVNEASAALKKLTPAQKANARAQLLAAGWTPKQAAAIVNFGHAHEFDSNGKYKRIAKKLTKGSQALRDKMLAPGGIKPLIDTARARNSQHATASKDGVDWSIVGYLGYSMGGTDKIPVRNPSPFVWTGSEWKLRESAMKSLGKHISAYVFMESL